MSTFPTPNGGFNMKNKESILKKEIDIANLSVSIIPTIAFIIIFAFAFSVSV